MASGIGKSNTAASANSSTYYNRRLEGKVALITGGAAGAGEAAARLFVEHGAKVVIVDIADDLGRSAAASIGTGEVICYAHCDVSVEDDVRRAVDFTVARYGKLDIMFNNAGVLDFKNMWRRITDVEASDMERVLSVNVSGVFLGTKHAARAMLASGGGGSIINHGSVAGVVGGVCSHAYVASKHAVVGLTRNAAAELGRYGVRANCISPYMYAARLSRDAMSRDDKGVEDMTAATSNLKGAVLTELDVAQAAVFLASDESKYMSGHNLVLDGGLTVINTSFGLFTQL